MNWMRSTNAAVKDIKNVMVRGVLPEGSSVYIENLTINTQVVPNATTATQFNLTDIKSPELRERILRAMSASREPTDKPE